VLVGAKNSNNNNVVIKHCIDWFGSVRTSLVYARLATDKNMPSLQAPAWGGGLTIKNNCKHDG